jgi:hypothetical protein
MAMPMIVLITARPSDPPRCSAARSPDVGLVRRELGDDGLC